MLNWVKNLKVLTGPIYFCKCVGWFVDVHQTELFQSIDYIGFEERGTAWCSAFKQTQGRHSILQNKL